MICCFTFTRSILFVFLLCCIRVIANSSEPSSPPRYLNHQLRALESKPNYKSQNATQRQILKAQALVDEAIAQQGLYNRYRVDNPVRNSYVSRNSAQAKDGKRNTRSRPSPPPSFNSTVRAAARLLAEHDAAAQHKNGTLHKIYRKPKHSITEDTREDTSEDTPDLERRQSYTYWLEHIEHTGRSPMGGDPNYKVFRNVKDPLFGAVGDGLTDDTEAINRAIDYNNNCGANCMSSSIKGTLIYFPAGTYLISSPINAYYYTQLVGDAIDEPVIKMAASFIGLGAIQTDVYYPGGDGEEWYIQQSNFFRQVRNFNIDVTAATVEKASAFHWQVAQATSLSRVNVYMSKVPGNTQLGMFTENGSGGFMSQCYFDGGNYGIYGGNQQYTVSGFGFTNQQTAAICLLWDWGWTWTQMSISDVPTGILLINPEVELGGQQAGSTYVLDTSFSNVGTAIKAEFPEDTILRSSIITLDNIQLSSVTTVVEFTGGRKLDIDPSQDVDFLVVGNMEADGPIYGSFDLRENVARRPASLTHGIVSHAKYLYKSKIRPQYSNHDVGKIISVKDHGAIGDGVHDDSDAIIATLALASETFLIYFPAGSYLVTKTILFPKGARITGEVWSQIVASGSYFADPENPKALVKVGNQGDVGSIEISDMMFTSIGSLPGLIYVEWNIKEDLPASAGMWDSHIRVGGAIGTQLQVAQCPPVMEIKSACVAASMLMHVTSSSSGYFENVWAWVADHDIDDPENKQISIAVGRGILVESDGPTWFYGTSSEHALLYQYNFYNATDSLAAMIQTESPYYQHSAATTSPGPFNSTLGQFGNDPSFLDADCAGTDLECDFAWAVMVKDVTGVTIAGAGLYSWFDSLDPAQACIGSQNCQQRLIKLDGGNTAFSIFNLITIGAVEMISDITNSVIVLAKENTQAIAHPFWSALAAYINHSEAEILVCSDDDVSDECYSPTECDLTIEFSSLQDLVFRLEPAAFPPICTEIYSIGAIANMLNTTMANFTTVNEGYDDVWGYYVKYIERMIPEALDEFMEGATPNNPSGGPGNKFFTCELYQHGETSEPRPCPLDSRSLSIPEHTVYYTIHNSTGFFDELEEAYGILEDWVFFDVKRHHPTCWNAPNCITIDQKKAGYPKKRDTITVPNPKTIITEAQPKMANLTQLLFSSQVDVNLGSWFGPIDDLLQVVSMPVFMIIQAVESMLQAKNIGEEMREQERKNLIALILSIIFAFIPFVGEAFALAGGVVAITRIVRIATIGLDIGLGIQQIVEDPLSAPMAILGMLGGGLTRNELNFKDLATTRRGLTTGDVTKMGTVFKQHDTRLQSLTAACRR